VNPSVHSFGDAALMVEIDGIDEAHRLARSIEAAIEAGTAPGGVGDIVIGGSSVVVHIEPSRVDQDTYRGWLGPLISDRLVAPVGGGQIRPGRDIGIPVDFDGPDLGEVAATSGLSVTEVVDLLLHTPLRVAFVGFSPGFPYLVGLPLPLDAVERRSTPRVRVPAGSVALAGGYAGIYPQATPGGWMLIGRTPTTLFDPDTPPYALLRAGDTVRFRRSDHPSVSTATGATGATTPRRSPIRASRDRYIEVLEPGLLTLVEDEGRTSLAATGVPRGGPADPDAMWLANRLVGNDAGTAAIEVTAIGPSLSMAGDVHVAVVGAEANCVDITVNGCPASTDTVIPVHDGQVIRIGRVHHGTRAYLAVAGGIETPPVMGSRASDVLTMIGPGALMTGDRLDLGAPLHPHGLLRHSSVERSIEDPVLLRVMAGPHRLPPDGLGALVGRSWKVTPTSNRVGLRLSGGKSGLTPHPRRVDSTGMVTGAIQVPPDGQPIVLLPDHATVGGYPVVACVISTDIGTLGQLGAGDTVQFELVDGRQAARLRREHDRALAGRVTGWFPTASGT
jgi:KipI family sensor histidine kinase inhibitor